MRKSKIDSSGIGLPNVDTQIKFIIRSETYPVYKKGKWLVYCFPAD